MNILVLTREFPPYVLGGISFHLKSLYNEMAERGHEMTIIAGKCPQSWNPGPVELSNNINKTFVQFGMRKGYYILYPLSLRKEFIEIDFSKYDVAISHTPLPFDIPDIPLVTKYHDCTPETRPYVREGLSGLDKLGDSLLQPFRQLCDQRSFKHSDFAIFNSMINKNGWKKHYSIKTNNKTIHNGVDTELFYPRDVGSNNFVLFVGSTHQKGLSSVINYANRHKRHVHIVGDIEVNHSNITTHNNIPQEELAYLYSEAAVTIHPAKFESFGNVVLESLACGTPVVTTKKCGASEILTNETGVVTDCIHDGIEQASTLKSDSCRSIAMNHQWSNVADETIDILNQIC